MSKKIQIKLLREFISLREEHFGNDLSELDRQALSYFEANDDIPLDLISESLVAPSVEKIKAMETPREGEGGEKFTLSSPLLTRREAMARGMLVACGCHAHPNTHNHTDFSVMDGVSKPEAMVETSAMRGFGGIGISDHGTMGGVLRAGKAGKEWKLGRDKETGAVFTYRKVKLKDYVSKYVLSDSEWNPLPVAGIDTSGEALVSHNTHDNSLFRIVGPGSFEPAGDFKVVSGCELYISWADQREKRYNHITVYATGMKGHEVLTMLTSIGSIPSRRYIGGGGFFRPRIFVEDLEIGVKMAEGELVVTTGCPGSITSEAYRKGDEAAAKRFFDWAERVIPRGRFFVELHLSDVSMEFNDGYRRAEDRFYAKAYGQYLSRFSLKHPEEARKAAERAQSLIRGFVLSESLAGYRMEYEGSFVTTVKAESIVEFAPEEIRRLRNDGTVYPIEKIGVRRDRGPIFGDDERRELRDDSMKVRASVESLLRQEGPEEAAPQGKKGAGASKKPKKKKKSDVPKLDEDSLLLLSEAQRVLEVYPRMSRSDGAEAARFVGAAVVARLVAVVSAVVSSSDNKGSVSVENSVRRILALPEAYGIGAASDREALSSLLTDPVLYLDQVEKMPGGVFEGAARALIDLFSIPVEMLSLEYPDLAPRGGAEDELEKEWIVTPGGNWLETVNRSLLAEADRRGLPIILATDSHMAYPDQKGSQDTVIRRGKVRGWHMPRAYAIPRAGLFSFIEDLGFDYSAAIPYLEPVGHSAYKMIESGAVRLEHIILGMGYGSLLMEEVKSVATFRWDVDVPRIRYESHKYYDEALEYLKSGRLKKFIEKGREAHGIDLKFTDLSNDIATSLVVITFKKAIASGLIPDNDPRYIIRLLSELHLCQEIGRERLCDFFLVLQEGIVRFRDMGVSVGPGRGSSGGMLIAMISGITYGDPIVYNFLRDRWMNPGRKDPGPGEAPAMADIDVDVDDRQMANYILALMAQESFLDSIKEEPLNPLEEILFAELFYSAEGISNEEQRVSVFGETGAETARQIIENPKRRELIEKSKKAEAERRARELLERMGVLEEDDVKAIQEEKRGTLWDEEEADSDDARLLMPRAGDGKDRLSVWQTPFFRVGTYMSLKCKAAIKEIIRLNDRTPFPELPSFAKPTPEWLSTLDRPNLTDEEKNRLYEEEVFGFLPMPERIARRRVQLAERLTSEMKAGAGLARLYNGNEHDYFMGSVYGVVPEYWDMTMGTPRGSTYAAAYFDKNPHIKNAVLKTLNIYKSRSVHAGGVCFGRKIFGRVAVRFDRFGAIGEAEMKDLETLGVMKFDMLGLQNLSIISQTLRMMVNELPREELSWVPDDVYEKVKGGESTDYLWRHMRFSTPEAVDLMCRSRGMIFQIDTPVYAKVLDTLDPEAIKALLRKSGLSLEDPKNYGLVNILNAECALFRPGPMKLMTHINYHKRLMGEPWEAAHPWLKPFVEETFGLIVYQEQVQRIWAAGAIKLDAEGKPVLDEKGNYIHASEAEADNVRRAMGKKQIKALEKINAEGRFKAGLAAQGVPAEIADQIWMMIVPFAEYGFNAPHSWHYGLIAAVTLFLKAHYRRFIFRTAMALVDKDTGARYVGEISHQVRQPCVLRSSAKFWDMHNDEYYPGLESIKKINTKLIDKLVRAQTKLRPRLLAGEKISGEEWWGEMGSVTEKTAEALAASGLLRIFGTPDQVADAYKMALLTRIKPREREAKREKDLLKKQKASLEASLGAVRTKATAPTTRSKNKIVVEKLSEDDLLTIRALRENGFETAKEIVETTDEDGKTVRVERESHFLTVKSALKSASVTKYKGVGMRALLNAIYFEDEQARARGEAREPRAYATIEEIQERRYENGAELRPGFVYTTVATPIAFGEAEIFKKKGSWEPTVTFIAEGKKQKLKFSHNFLDDPKRLHEIIETLKKGKGEKAFLIDIFFGVFVPKDGDGTERAYYKINGIEPVQIAQDTSNASADAETSIYTHP